MSTDEVHGPPILKHKHAHIHLPTIAKKCCFSECSGALKERDNNSGGKRSKDDDGNKQIMRTTLVSTLLTAEGQVRVWTTADKVSRLLSRWHDLSTPYIGNFLTRTPTSSLLTFGNFRTS